jgi:ribosomal protein S18 acetylase RimI-like enzyme
VVIKLPGHLVAADTRGSLHAQALVVCPFTGRCLFPSITSPLRAASNVHTKSLTAFAMEDVREPLTAPDQIPKSGSYYVPTGATGTVSLKSTVDYMAPTTPTTRFNGSRQESPDGLSIESRAGLFKQTAPEENTDLHFNGADGASPIADFLAARAVNSDAVAVDLTRPMAQAGDSGSDHATNDDDRPESSLDLYSLTPVDWWALRAARLQALLDSPHAFTSTYAREWRWSEPDWRRLFDSATWIRAREAHKVVGLARSVSEPKQPAARHVESVWVARTHRRRGVFRALLQAIADRERREGATDLLLWVLEDNYDAQRVYKALGFEPTGERQFLPAVRRFERRLRLGIGHLKDS